MRHRAQFPLSSPSVPLTAAFEPIAGRPHPGVACTLEVGAASFGIGRHPIALLEHHAKIGA